MSDHVWLNPFKIITLVSLFFYLHVENKKDPLIPSENNVDKQALQCDRWRGFFPVMGFEQENSISFECLVLIVFRDTFFLSFDF